VKIGSGVSEGGGSNIPLDVLACDNKINKLNNSRNYASTTVRVARCRSVRHLGTSAEMSWVRSFVGPPARDGTARPAGRGGWNRVTQRTMGSS